MFDTARNILSAEAWVTELHDHRGGRGRSNTFNKHLCLRRAKRIETLTGQDAFQFTLRRCAVRHNNKIFSGEGCTRFHVSLLNTHQNWLKDKSAGEQ
jgi:hypothetical protein